MSNNTQALRPKTIEGFVGQGDIISQLDVILGAARKRDKLPGHMLFSGPPGLGKTSLAMIIADYLGVDCLTLSGPTLDKPGDAVLPLVGLRKKSIVFIDEIHSMDRTAEEVLYTAMDDGQVFLQPDGKSKANVTKIPIADICLVGATTQAGGISKPLRDRFEFHGRFVPYTEEELSSIVSTNAQLLGLDFSDAAARLVAQRSRQTPRVANQLLSRLQDWAVVHSSDVLDEQAVEDAFRVFGVDELGLDEVSQHLLETLVNTFKGGPVGLGRLSAAIGENATVVEHTYEPYLINAGLISYGPQGRIATEAGVRHIEHKKGK